MLCWWVFQPPISSVEPGSSGSHHRQPVRIEDLFCKTIHPTSVSSSVKIGRLLDPGGNFFSIFFFSSFRLLQQMPFLKPGLDLSNFGAWPRYKRFVLYRTGPFRWHRIPQSDTEAYHSWGFAHAHFLLDLSKDMHWLICAEIDFGLLLCEVFWEICRKYLLRYLPKNFGTALLWRSLLIFSKIVQMEAGCRCFPSTKLEDDQNTDWQKLFIVQATKIWILPARDCKRN